MNNEIKGTILALLTALISGFSIPLNKVFLVTLDPVLFTAIRATIIGAVFLVLSLYKNRFKADILKTKWHNLLVIGLVGGGLAFLLFFTGLKFTTSARGALLHKTLPVYVAILAYVFLREKISKYQSFAILAMLGGTIAIYFSQISPAVFFTNPQLGDALIILATILWAIEAVVAKKVMLGGDSNIGVSFVRMGFGAVFLWGVAAVLGKTSAVLALTSTQWLYITASTAILFAYVLTFYWSMKLINASKATALLLLAPVITLAISVFYLKETYTIIQLLGSAAILAGAFFMVRQKSEFVSGH